MVRAKTSANASTCTPFVAIDPSLLRLQRWGQWEQRYPGHPAIRVPTSWFGRGGEYDADRAGYSWGPSRYGWQLGPLRGGSFRRVGADIPYSLEPLNDARSQLLLDRHVIAADLLAAMVAGGVVAARRHVLLDALVASGCTLTISRHHLGLEQRLVAVLDAEPAEALLRRTRYLLSVEGATVIALDRAHGAYR